MKLLVSRREGTEREVTPLELFFDLVYVFAIGELAHHLVEHVDLRTAAETLILALAVIYAWFMTAWGSNWLDPGRLPVRLLLVGLMFASLLMSVSIADAFGDRAWLFVTGYLLLQVGRAVFLIVALRGRPHSAHFVNDLIWEAGVGVLWIAGAIADGDARIVLWAIAVAATQAGVWSLHWLPGRGRAVDVAHTEVSAPHLIERFRLFFIIALGESVLSAGNAFAGEPYEPERLAALAVAFTGTVALWWCYFERAERIGADAAEAAEDAGMIGLRGTWTLVLIVLALIAIAVGDEMAIAHPHDDPTTGFTLLAFGGVALFLLAQTLFVAGTIGTVSRSRVIALGALLVLALATASSSLITGIAATTAVLAAVAAADTLATRRPPAPPPARRAM